MLRAEWGILGSNVVGKSRPTRVISGSDLPHSGRMILKTLSVPLPLAFGYAFQRSFTGRDSSKLILRVYGVNIVKTLVIVKSFAELGLHLDEGVKNYSLKTLSRFAFAISMGINFDSLLVEEAGWSETFASSRTALVNWFETHAQRAMLMVVYLTDIIRTYCHHTAVLAKGHLTGHDTVPSALAANEAL